MWLDFITRSSQSKIRFSIVMICRQNLQPEGCQAPAAVSKHSMCRMHVGWVFKPMILAHPSTLHTDGSCSAALHSVVILHRSWANCEPLAIIISVGRRSSRVKPGGISGTDLEQKGELDCAFCTRHSVRNTGERPACLQDVEKNYFKS